MVLELTEKQLFDYSICPARYAIEHKLRVVPETSPSLSKLLGRVANSLLLSLLNGKALTTGQLKDKWDRVCEDNRAVMTQQNCLTGLDMLLAMYRWAEDERLRVADFKIPYQYLMRKEEPQIILKGEIAGAIIPKGNNSFELLELDFSSRYPDQALIDMNLKRTIDWKMCSLMSKDAELAGIRIHHVKSNKDWYTVRGKEDFERMDASIRAIATCIDNELFYPRETVMCSTCEVKNFCRLWRGNKLDK